MEGIEFFHDDHKMGPKTIVINGVTWGPYNMTKNKWVSLGFFTLKVELFHHTYKLL